jgi:hypothetical protein
MYRYIHAKGRSNNVAQLFDTGYYCLALYPCSPPNSLGEAGKGIDTIARGNTPGEKKPLITSLTLPAPIGFDGCGKGERAE